MTNIIQSLEQEQVSKLIASKSIPDFSPGDTVKVNVKVVEGDRERVQAFEGVVIARKNAGLNSSFTVRKISYGEGVERIFPLYSPRLTSVEVVRWATSVARSSITSAASAARPPASPSARPAPTSPRPRASNASCSWQHCRERR